MPQAYRTSNLVDRLIHYQDRILDMMQYFHGTFDAAIQGARAMVLIWNFHPYCRRTLDGKDHPISPFEQLNGFCYRQHWLRNFLIASSLNARGNAPSNKHRHKHKLN